MGKKKKTLEELLIEDKKSFQDLMDKNISFTEYAETIEKLIEHPDYYEYNRKLKISELEDLIKRVIKANNLSTTLTNNYLADKESKTPEQKELRFKAVKDFISIKSLLSENELYKDKSGSVLGIVYKKYVDEGHDDYIETLKGNSSDYVDDDDDYERPDMIYGCDGMDMPTPWN